MQILFRGKNNSRNWKYGYYYKKQNSAIIICSSSDEHIEVISSTIGIYSNIDAVTSKKIFTGDIIPISEYDVSILVLHDLVNNEIAKNYKTKIVTQHCKVSFSEGSFGVFISKSVGILPAGAFYLLSEIKERQIKYGFGDIMVIGNVIDNPNILTPSE